MTARSSNFANAFETALSAEMGPLATTATVVTTVGGPESPCYLVIEGDDADQREYIFFNGIFTGTTFTTSTLDNRYLAGSGAASGITHPSGSAVRQVTAAQMFEDLHDRADELVTLTVPVSGGTFTGLVDVTRGTAVGDTLNAVQHTSRQTVETGDGSEVQLASRLRRTTAGTSPAGVAVELARVVEGATETAVRLGDDTVDVTGGALLNEGAAVVKFEAGTYTGDETANRLIELPFDPVKVTVSTATGGIRWESAVGAASAGMRHSNVGAEAAVQANNDVRLDTGGFRVDGEGASEQDTNASGQTYYYEAFG